MTVVIPIPPGSFTACSFTLNLQDVANASAFQNLFIRFELKNYGDATPGVPGVFVLIPPFKDFYPNSSGTITGEIVGNDVISPINTFYTISFFGNGECFYRCNTIITGTSLDLNNLNCLSDDELPLGGIDMDEYDFQLFYSGRVMANVLITQLIFTRTVIFSLNMAGSYAESGVVSTNLSDLVMCINGASFGNIQFNAGSSIGTFISPVQMFNPGDVLTILGPSSSDPTFSNLSISLVGNQS